MSVRGARVSPNIWHHPAVYEQLNRAADPDGLVAAALAELAPWQGGVVADVGCGSGYHLPGYAATARAVIGVEPYAPLVAAARRRCVGLAHVRVRPGTAQQLPLPDSSVDAVHARWAYFFGPGCEPGLAEASRVLRRGGSIALVDVDARTGAYGRWFRAAFPDRDPDDADRFFARHGFSTHRLATRWVFRRRDELEAVLRIEFPPAVAERAVTETPGLEVAVGQVIRHRPG